MNRDPPSAGKPDHLNPRPSSAPASTVTGFLRGERKLKETVALVGLFGLWCSSPDVAVAR